MIIIGEKINGAIPSVRQAITDRNEVLIRERTLAQVKAGADFLDCALYSYRNRIRHYGMADQPHAGLHRRASLY